MLLLFSLKREVGSEKMRGDGEGGGEGGRRKKEKGNTIKSTRWTYCLPH